MGGGQRGQPNAPPKGCLAKCSDPPNGRSRKKSLARCTVLVICAGWARETLVVEKKEN